MPEDGLTPQNQIDPEGQPTLSDAHELQAPQPDNQIPTPLTHELNDTDQPSEPILETPVVPESSEQPNGSLADNSEPTPNEAQRTHNPTRAWAIAEAMDSHSRERHSKWGKELIEEAGRQASDEYDISTFAKQTHRTPEIVTTLLKSNTWAFLKYIHAVAENYREFGDQLSPSQEAAETIYELAQRCPEILYGRVSNDDMAVSLSRSSAGSGRVTLEISHLFSNNGADREQWSISPFKFKEPNTYTITSVGDDAQFSSITTIKQRPIEAEDATRLKELVADIELEHDKSQDDEKQSDSDTEKLPIDPNARFYKSY